MWSYVSVFYVFDCSKGVTPFVEKGMGEYFYGRGDLCFARCREEVVLFRDRCEHGVMEQSHFWA